MSAECPSFQDMLQRVRRGDAESIVQFVAKYEPFIRRTVRYRLARGTLKSLADSVDICQSVLGSVLIRLSAGEYEVDSEDGLQRLLATVAMNKFRSILRREHAQKRDRRLTVRLTDDTEIVDTRGRPLDESLSMCDLLATFERRLRDDERALFQQRQAGLSWQDIAVLLGEDATKLRKRYSRAVSRVTKELHIDDETDDA